MFTWVNPHFLLFFGPDQANLTSDLEADIADRYQDRGPLFIYKGFNSLLAYSIDKDTYYKSSLGQNIKFDRAERRMRGATPAKVEPDLFGRVLTKVKEQYYFSPKANPQKFDEVINTILRLGQKYNFNLKALQGYVDHLGQYRASPFFSKTHGDLWRGNIFITPANELEIIDEEKDRFGLIPVDVTRFLLSLIGYETLAQGGLYLDRIASAFPGFITKEVVQDFYLAALFLELLRYDYSEGVPRNAIFSFYTIIQDKLTNLATAS